MYKRRKIMQNTFSSGYDFRFSKFMDSPLARFPLWYSNGKRNMCFTKQQFYDCSFLILQLLCMDAIEVKLAMSYRKYLNTNINFNLNIIQHLQSIMF